MEIWKDIPNLKGYQVSNIGRIKSLKFKNEKILKYFVNEIGYPTINLYEGTKRKQYRVHRLVAQAFIDNPNNKPCINHIDGNKQNNTLDNLEWCTYQENENHSRKVLKKKVNVNNYNKMKKERDLYKNIVDKAIECISNFLCTEEYINVDGKAIANNYEKILEILNGGENNR